MAAVTTLTPTDQGPAPVTVTVKTQANLRSGPGTGYAKVGTAAPGSTLVVIGRTADGQWLQLAMNAWVYTALVSAVPTTLPVVDGQATPAATAVPQPTAVPTVTVAPPLLPPPAPGQTAPGAVPPVLPPAQTTSTPLPATQMIARLIGFFDGKLAERPVDSAQAIAGPSLRFFAG